MVAHNPLPREFSCLIVDDDQAFAAMAAQVVRGEGGTVTLAASLGETREITSRRTFDLVLLDNHLPDGKGYAFFEQFARQNPEVPIIMITGVPDLGKAVALTRNGLFDYVTKPVNLDALVACIQRARLRIATRETPASTTEMSGESSAMVEVLALLRQAAKHAEATVLLTGESGAGKDVAARTLHQLTYRDSSAPYIAVNCAAIPAEIFEAELFGAERGAYTGADKKRAGLVAAAARGTLFLDEIGEVPLGLQGKLLRLLDAREYRSLGSTEVQLFTGRFVGAKNRNLAAEVRAGRFREDLLYRFDVFAVELPPLRKRRADIPSLAEMLLGQLAKKYSLAKPLLKPEDLAALTLYDFPGNVRELRNILERALLRSTDESKWLALGHTWLNREAPSQTPAPKPAAAPDISLPPDRDLSPVEAQEYRLIRDTLREHHGGIRRAAAALGMSPQALLRRLEKWPELRPTRG